MFVKRYLKDTLKILSLEGASTALPPKTFV